MEKPAPAACDELGIDTVSAGGTIAFAMECVERGLLDEGWLTFGSGDAVLKALDLIGGREGVGDLLAEGSRRAALAMRCVPAKTVCAQTPRSC